MERFGGVALVLLLAGALALSLGSGAHADTQKVHVVFSNHLVRLLDWRFGCAGAIVARGKGARHVC